MAEKGDAEEEMREESAGWERTKTLLLGKRKDGEDPPKAPFREPPPGVDVPAGQLRVFRFLHWLSRFSLVWSVSGRTGFDYSAPLLGPLFWTVDFAVLLALEEDLEEAARTQCENTTEGSLENVSAIPFTLGGFGSERWLL